MDEILKLEDARNFLRLLQTIREFSWTKIDRDIKIGGYFLCLLQTIFEFLWTKY